MVFSIINHPFGDTPISGNHQKRINDKELVGGWAYPSEKNISSSLGMMIIQYMGKHGKITFMFQTTNQIVSHHQHNCTDFWVSLDFWGVCFCFELPTGWLSIFKTQISRFTEASDTSVRRLKWRSGRHPHSNMSKLFLELKLCLVGGFNPSEKY